MEMLHIRLKQGFIQQLKAIAALEDKSLTQLLGEIVACFLESKEAKVIASE